MSRGSNSPLPVLGGGRRINPQHGQVVRSTTPLCPVSNSTRLSPISTRNASPCSPHRREPDWTVLSTMHVILGLPPRAFTLATPVLNHSSRFTDHLRSALRAFPLVARHACLVRLAVPAVRIRADAIATWTGGLWAAHASRPAALPAAAACSTTSTHLTHLLV
jgi:hypothetical protein